MSSNEDSKLASSFISRSFPLSFLSYDSTGPHRVQFDSNNQLQDLSTNTHLICGCPDFQRVRQPSAPPAHCLCCFSLFLFSIISLTLMRMRQYRTSVQTELISLDAAKLSSGALKEKEQLVHSTQETNLSQHPVSHPPIFPFSAKKKKGGKLQLHCCSFTSNVKSSWRLIRHRPVPQMCKPGVISFVTGSMNNHLAHYSFLIFYLKTPGDNTIHIGVYIIGYRTINRQINNI